MQLIQNHTKKIIVIILIILFFGLILGYAYSKSRNLINGPEIKIEGVIDGQTVLTPTLELSGFAKRAIHFFINDREIFIEQDGSWKENLSLNHGYNIIDFKAEDKFGKKDEKIFHIISEFTEGTKQIIN